MKTIAVMMMMMMMMIIIITIIIMLWNQAVHTDREVTANRPGGPPAWGLGEVLTTPLRKNQMLRITHKLRYNN